MLNEQQGPQKLEKGTCWITSPSPSITVKKLLLRDELEGNKNPTIIFYDTLLTLANNSGKSSIILAMLRFLHLRGTIKIDGQDVNAVPHDFLRSRITVLSQDGVELLGSVRINLDPFDKVDSTHRLHDDTLIAVLTKVGLWSEIESKGANLDTELKSLRFSHGQKQLLCLARAILRREYMTSRIVLLDEVTSQVDLETDKRMQAVMEESFSACTVIIVTHRLETVNMAEIALEMDDGKISRVRKRDPVSKAWIES